MDEVRAVLRRAEPVALDVVVQLPMWSRTSRISDVIPSSFEQRSAITAPDSPAPTISRSTFFGAVERSPPITSGPSGSGASDVSPPANTCGVERGA